VNILLVSVIQHRCRTKQIRHTDPFSAMFPETTIF